MNDITDGTFHGSLIEKIESKTAVAGMIEVKTQGSKIQYVFITS